MKKKKEYFEYIELVLLFIAFICCFIPCLVYENGLIIDIYIFDANKIMGYLYMILLVFGIIYKIVLIRKKKNDKFIYKYWSLIIILIGTILYTISCLIRRNILIHFSLGFYILLGSLFIMILWFITKLILFNKTKSKKRIKKN